MALISFYLLLCVVRSTMPGWNPKERNKIVLMRMSIGLAGACAGYLFMYLVYLSKGHLVRDVEVAQKIGDGIFIAFAVASEVISRRALKRLDSFKARRHIPWTY